MKFLKQFGIILLISFVGEVLNALIPLPVPASIYGLVILFSLLRTGILPLDSVKDTGKFLIEIMPLMFIPAAVGLMDSWDIVKPMWMVLAVITVCSTIIVMGVTGRLTQRVIRRGQKETGSELE